MDETLRLAWDSRRIIQLLLPRADRGLLLADVDQRKLRGMKQVHAAAGQPPSM
jgi:hypothetical protein